MLCDDLLNKLYCGVYEMRNGNGIRFQKVEPSLDVWAVRDDLLNKLYCGVYEMRNGNGIRFQKVEPSLDVWAAHGQPTCSVFGTVKISPQFV